MASIKPGSRIWVPHPAKVYVLAEVLAVDAVSCTARTVEEGKVTQIDFAEKPPFISNPKDDVEDMTALYHIHEPAILQNLETRSLNNEPYTFMASVLVAVNPLRPIPHKVEAGSPKVATSGPHPFAIAELAYRQMAFQGGREIELLAKGGKGDLQRANQSCIVSGESGAGKTEASKMILNHLVKRAATSSSGTGDLDVRLLGTNPILEAFGNAVTLRNPNSSRFGKLLRLHFDVPSKSEPEWNLVGATVTSYLLERSRVTSHEMGERAYHIFYQLVREGKSHPLLEGCELGAASDKSFAYAREAPSAQDEGMFDHVTNAFKSIGVSDENLKQLLRSLAGILHMGNVEFVDVDVPGKGSIAKIALQQDVEVVARLFGVEPGALARVFCERRIETVGESVVSTRTARAAQYARDACAKALYSSLFDWTIARINEALLPTSKNKGCLLGVLDIFGFESFQVNGFEQLLINFCNEALQGTFNNQIFVAEAALYLKEGLVGADDYLNVPSDNQICVELLMGDPSKKEPGLLLTIDSEGRTPDANDTKLNLRLHMNFGNHPCMIKPHPKDIARTFIIRHYAGPVVYTVGTFLEKNSDRVPDEWTALMQTSSSSLIKGLIAPPPPPLPPPGAQPGKPPGPPGSKSAPPARSIVHKFTAQIRSLIDDLEATRCSFVRCVKPNPLMVRNHGDSSWFDRRYVSRQLICLNVPQTAEVLRNGFPSRIEYSALIESYGSVLPNLNLARGADGARDDKSFVRALFFAFGIASDTYKLGVTRVFFKSGQLAQLDEVMRSSSSVDLAVIKRFRFYYAQVRWRKGILAVMAYNRLAKSMLKIRRRNAAARRIQSVARRRLARRRFLLLRKGAIAGQRVFRGGVGRKKAAKRRAEVIAEAQRQAELARKRADEEAAARAAKAEKEAREAEERMKREQQEAALAAEAALAKQQQERQQATLELIKMRRKSSVGGGMLRKSTRVQENPDDGSVTVRAGQRLRVSTSAHPGSSQRPSVSVMVRAGDSSEAVALKRTLSNRMDEASKRRVQRRQAARRGTSIQKGGIAALRSTEGKSADEKLATLKREEFGIPVMGDCQVLSLTTLPGKKLMGVITLKKPVSKSTWTPRYYVIDKPKRSLILFESPARRKQISRLELSKETLIKNYPTKDFSVEVVSGGVSLVLALSSQPEFLEWQRDLREAMAGFKAVGAQAPDDDGDDDGLDAEFGDQSRADRVAQLHVLLRQGQITKKEFDAACEEVAKGGGGDADEEEALEEYGAQVACPRCGTSNNTSFGNFTCVKCYADLPKGDAAEVYGDTDDLGIKPEPLTRPIFAMMPYDFGRLSCGMGGIGQRMDLRTYEEVDVCALQMRFRDEDDADLEIGWTVSHALEKFRGFADSLAGKQGPLVAADAKKVPKMPTPLTEQAISEWLAALIAAIPSSDAPAEPVADEKVGLNDVNEDDEAVLVASAWRSVKDPVSGDVYYYNKRTGETTWDDPFPDSPPPLPPKPVMPAGWEAVLDQTSGDFYYWHKETGETTWDRPAMPAQSVNKVGLKDLLKIKQVIDFFDLRNSERLNRLV